MSSEKQPHKHLKSSVARLMAVQALYSLLYNEEPMKMVLNDYLSRYSGMDVEGEHLPPPDTKLFSAILQGVEERRDELQEMVHSAQNKLDSKAEAQKTEPLLNSIFLCGAYELLARHETDAPIIINDYLDVAHSFYGVGEAGLVNAVLDKLNKALRAS